jgi:hypothetical protein
VSISDVLLAVSIGCWILFGLLKLYARADRRYEGAMYCTNCGHPVAYIEQGGHAVTLESKGLEVEA